MSGWTPWNSALLPYNMKRFSSLSFRLLTSMRAGPLSVSRPFSGRCRRWIAYGIPFISAHTLSSAVVQGRDLSLLMMVAFRWHFGSPLTLRSVIIDWEQITYWNRVCACVTPLTRRESELIFGRCRTRSCVHFALKPASPLIDIS